MNLQQELDRLQKEMRLSKSEHIQTLASIIESSGGTLHIPDKCLHACGNTNMYNIEVFRDEANRRTTLKTVWREV